MNWARGFFRLWLIGAVVWVLLVGMIELPQAVKTYWDFRTVPADMIAEARTAYGKAAEAESDDKTAARRELGRRLTMADDDVIVFLWLGLMPPVIVFMLGFGVRWALRGFRQG